MALFLWAILAIFFHILKSVAAPVLLRAVSEFLPTVFLVGLASLCYGHFSALIRLTREPAVVLSTPSNFQ